jgi:Uma2 family endonuclease
MGLEAKKFATYEDLLNVPDHLIAEIIAGELITSPRPGPKHTRTASTLGIQVGGPFDLGTGGPGGWWILDEPEIHLKEEVLVPDLAGWRRDLYPNLPSLGGHFTAAPQWVCEILSKSTARVDRVIKLPVYAREKVEYVWLIDPELKTLDVFLLNDHRWTLLNSFVENDKIRAAPFDAVEIDLGALWLPD